MIREVTFEVTITNADATTTTAVPINGTITEDASWTPRIQASLTFPASKYPTLLDGSNVLDAATVSIECVSFTHGFSKTYILHTRGAREDLLADTVTLDVASDEALIIDWGERTSASTFAGVDYPLVTDIAEQVLQLTYGYPIGIGVIGVPPGPPSAQNRVVAPGETYWDYLTALVGSVGKDLWWSWDGAVYFHNRGTPIGTSMYVVPPVDQLLSCNVEHSREGDYADHVITEWTIGEPTYSIVTPPGSGTSVTVQNYAFGRADAVNGGAGGGSRARQKSVTAAVSSSALAPVSLRDSMAETLLRRRMVMGKTTTIRAPYHPDVHSHWEITGSLGTRYIERVSVDVARAEMTVTLREPNYAGAF